MAVSTSSLVGKRVGKYRLERLIGRGATANVYLAVGSDGRKIAIKLLSRESDGDREERRRFEREASSASRLDHPSIIQVLEQGTYQRRPYIAMEFMHGGSLRRLLDRRARPDRVVEALAQVAEALAYAHAQRVVHRDIKPENILLRRSRRAKLADFGLARDEEASMSLTSEGRVLGTARYLSPEQARGARATPASDVYSFGVVLYEAVAGVVPFESDSPYGFLFQHAEVKPARPRVRRGYPKALRRLAMRCLAKEPSRRPSMAHVAEEIRAALRVEGGRRRRVRQALIATAVLLLVAIAVLATPRALDPLCRGASLEAACAVQQHAQRVRDAILP